MNISQLSEQFQRGIRELERDGFFCGSIPRDVTVTAEQGTDNLLEFDKTRLNIVYTGAEWFYRALLLWKNAGYAEIRLSEKRAFGEFGFMLDCSRNAVTHADGVKQLVRNLALLGYNQLQLYTEDTYEVDGEPYFGYLRGRYSKAELKELDAYAALFGIELVPCIQTLAHLNALVRWAPYAQIRDCDDILLAGDERTYRLVDHMFSTLAQCFTSRKVNIGMDEAHMVGRGKYLDEHGICDRFEILCTHLKQVNEIAGKYGFSPMMWSDMFFRLANQGDYYSTKDIPQSVKDNIPSNVRLIYWDYYNTDTTHYDDMLRTHKKFDNEIVFAGGAWKWVGFAPYNDYGIRATEAALSSCIRQGVQSAFLTAWGDNGGECPAFSVLPTITFAAQKAYGHDDELQLHSVFATLTDCEWEDFMLLDLPNRVPADTKEDICNPTKYMLFSDYFNGTSDAIIQEGDGAIFADYAQKLKKLESHPKWGVLFSCLVKLCDVLVLKYDLGLLTRKYYQAKDTEGLKRLLTERYTPLPAKIDAFYEAFAKQWATWHKPQGFDVQDIRIGALLQRTKSCTARLKDYLDGKTSEIPELAEQLLDPWGNGTELQKRAACNNNWGNIVTVNTL